MVRLGGLQERSSLKEISGEEEREWLAPLAREDVGWDEGWGSSSSAAETEGQKICLPARSGGAAADFHMLRFASFVAGPICLRGR